MKSANKKAALYVRVSTDAQREEGYSIDAQQEMLAAYCKSKGIAEYAFYVDGGFTGSNLDRPAMHQLIDDAKNHRIGFVIVYKLDRISRSQKDTLYLIEDVFIPHDVAFISINESFDTSTAFGRAMIGILSVFAQLERENIRERTRMGMKERVKSGLWMGGGRIPFGYDYDPQKGILVPNKDAQTVRRIYELYLQGYSLARIAQIVGLKYEKLALQILTRKSNAGFICYNDEEYHGLHEPIISAETYQKAMDLMRERSVRRLSTSCHLLTGIVFCGKCGAKMRYAKWGKQGFKLYCYSQDQSKPHLVRDPDCDNEKIWADELEDTVIQDLFQFAVDDSGEDKAEAVTLNVLELLRAQYDACANRIRRLYNLYADAADELLLETIEAGKKELTKIGEQIEAEQKQSVTAHKYLQMRKKIANLSDAWEYMTLQERQNIIRTLVRRITVTDNKIDIEYNFKIST